METAFFWLSKIIWYAISPDTVLVLLVLASWILLVRRAIVWARRLLVITTIAMLVLACFPIGEWVLYPLESRFPANPRLPGGIDGIIVLGGAEDAARSFLWDQVEVNDAAERFLASITLLKRYPNAKIVFTSGSGNLIDQRQKGADVARRLYLEQGIDATRIVFESNARNTAENALLSKALVSPAQGETWVVITSAFHMPRSVGIFCKVGWPVVGFPVDHRTLRGELLRIDPGVMGNLTNLLTGVREWVGLLAYYTFGKTSSLFPTGCDQ